MNRSTAQKILAAGKALAPDRFPAVPRAAAEQQMMLDLWATALSEVNLPDEVWYEAVLLWANHLAGDRMVTTGEMIRAAYLVRDRWENVPEKRAQLEAHRLQRLNENYERMGLEPVEASALQRHDEVKPVTTGPRGGLSRLGDVPIERRR